MFSALLSAEQNLHNDPNITMVKVRMFGEMCAQNIAKLMRLPVPPTQDELINVLRASNKVSSLIDPFTQIRILGNKAVHNNYSSYQAALKSLGFAHKVAFWFYKLKSGNSESLTPMFINPEPRHVLVEQELTMLREQLKDFQDKSEGSEELIRHKQDKIVDLKGYISILESQKTETEQQAQARIAVLETQLRRQQEAFDALSEEQQNAQVIELESRLKKNKLELSEEETRFIIDQQLQTAGWEADSELLDYRIGARPEVGKNRAIAEWVFEDTKQRADYVLFIGLQPVAIVEAKKKALSVRDALPQAADYVQRFPYIDYAARHELTYVGSESAQPTPRRKTLSLKKVAEDSPSYQSAPAANSTLREAEKLKPIPYIYSANGREYLQQLKSQSGIWFANADGTQERVIAAFHSPEDIQAKMAKNREKAIEWLNSHSREELDLFTPSEAAVQSVEEAIMSGRETMLVAMATGTGKTRVAGATMYRLLTSGLCRNVLFLVDRRSLGSQAVKSFKEYRIRQLPLADHYSLYELGEKVADAGTKPWIQVATVQSLSLMLQSDNNPLTPGLYDCIIVDEAHRGYNDDLELTEGEMLFRDQKDYQSKYRAVLDYFDAIKIGLTATPVEHTRAIFGDPIYQYRFKQAVLDGRLVDQEPMIEISTELSEQGISLQAGDTVKQFIEGDVVEKVLEDEINIDISGFNKRVIVPSFNKAVCNVLPSYIDPTQPAKTLVFCVNDTHAEQVVDLLRETYQSQLGNEVQDAIIKITGKSAGGDSKRIEELIRRYRTERLPNIVVTVDLLTTGIDVPSISNLVFLRQVKSLVLYEQMKGRGTRLCKEINKQSFRIIDAVNLKATIEKEVAGHVMSTVGTKVTTSYAQLIDEMASPDANQHKELDGTTFAQQSLESLVLKLSRTLNKTHSMRFDKESVGKEAATFQAMLEQSLPELEGKFEQLPKHLLQLGPMAAAKWLKENPWVITAEENLRNAINFGERAPLLFEGEVGEVTVTQDWGGYEQPEEYLDAFNRYIQENSNTLAALNVIVNRPRDLTKEDLVALMTKLEMRHFNEQTLLQARKAAKQEDVAARIIGLIRQAAIGSPLIPFEQRLTHAHAAIMAKYKLTDAQQKWLDRIVNQMREDLILNDDSFKVGTLRTRGGKSRADKDLGGQLDAIMKDLVDATWGESA